MKKTFRLEDLDCANCAAKMEEAVQGIEGVESASISFMQQRLVLEAGDDCFERVLVQAQKLMKKIEPDVRIMV